VLSIEFQLRSYGQNFLWYQVFEKYADTDIERRNPERQNATSFEIQNVGTVTMLCLLIIGLLVASIPIYRSQLKVAAILDLAVVLVLLAFRVFPGTAHLVDWILIISFFLDGSIVFLSKEGVLI
jgi:heme/copper-type cytochrome/quinol oxidase subunit 4